MKIDQVSTKKCFVFDAFGTLFKTTEVQAALTKIAGNKTDSLLNVWRSKQLQYTWLRNAMKQYAPFSTVTREALDYSMRLHGITDEKVFDILLPLYDTPQLIDGAKDLLKTLKAQGKTVAILSNGTRSMLDNGVQLTGVQFYVDHILSVDDIGIYKPDPAVYQMALERLGATTDELIFFSSNQWDVSGASTSGLNACWINQYGETREGLPFGEVVEVGSLAELTEYLIF